MSNPCRLDDTTQNKVAYAIGYEKGRAEIIEELKRFTHTNILGKKFIFVEDYMFEKLSFAEELKEKDNG